MHTFILHIETSTELCSVALSDNNQCMAVREDAEGRNHATMLTSFIEELLKEQGIPASQLDAVSVSSGPGSYTGLRIGSSTAKGICYGAGIPLIAIPTLQAMSLGFVLQHTGISSEALLCPMIDARRMEVYTALYDQQGNLLEKVSAEIITEQSFKQWLEYHQIYFFGNGADKCSTIVNHPNALFSTEYTHSAKYLVQPAWQAYSRKQFEHVAYYEPFYLKDFIAGKPKQLL